MSPDSSSRNLKNELRFLHFSLDSANMFICSFAIIDDRFDEILTDSFVKSSLFLYCANSENFHVFFGRVFSNIIMQNIINFGRVKEVFF